jgi:D-ribulokinase
MAILHRRQITIGLDVGTTGVRALAATTRGEVLAEASVLFENPPSQGFVHEQNPEDWWSCACRTLQQVCSQLRRSNLLCRVQGVAVTSTSGSLVLTDGGGCPLRPAILYDDMRGVSIAKDLNLKLAWDTNYNSSFSLIKACWVRQEEPAIWDRVHRLLHPTDWLTGRLTGCYEISDETNALKLGYNIEVAGWDRAVSLMKIPPGTLPQIVRPGTWVGGVSPKAVETGLGPGTPVFAGATDGITSIISSGAHKSGDANTTSGATIVWKVLSLKKPLVGEGIYCHRHPAGFWAPGAAGNSGLGAIRRDGMTCPPADMDRLAADHLPSPFVCYLLPGKGERFPFLNPEAVSFFEGKPSSPTESYAAHLQSLAFVERWGYERLERSAIEIGKVIYSTGSAAASPTFCQLRADVLKKRVARSQHPNSAFGAAILAATGAVFGGDLQAAMKDMTCVHEIFNPHQVAVQEYDRIYRVFREACIKRGYV